MKQVVIIGGGLAGLINAILLSRKGIEVTLYEKKQYPFHKVCGEYISNEVVPFLKREGLYPNLFDPPQISCFQFTSIKGRSFETSLEMGGFGISRFSLDNFLREKAIKAGATIVEKMAVSNLTFRDDHFDITLADNRTINAEIVIAAHGKMSNIDKKLDRKFTHQRSPFIGVKYHLKTDFPKDKIALHNFQGGYCGISAIESDKYNLCYLGDKSLLKKYGSIDAYEEAILKENPLLKHIYDNSDFLFDKPEVINAFSFKPKKAVEQHVLMSGDAAGLITPLCGNGMAMAIHSAFLLSEIISECLSSKGFNRSQAEMLYSNHWNSNFQRRLKTGRRTQTLFGSRVTSEIAASLMSHIPRVARAIIKNTHGQPF